MENKGLENLIPINERSKEEARAISAKGGVNSGKARRKKRELKKILELILSQPSKDNPAIDNYTEMCIAQVAKANAGDTKAFTAIRDTIGQKPAEEVKVSSDNIKITIEE